MEEQLIRVCLPEGKYLDVQGVSVECLGEPVRIDFGRTVDGSPLFPGGILAPQNWTEIQKEEGGLIRLKGKGTQSSWVFIFPRNVEGMATVIRDVESFIIALSSIVRPPVGWKSIPIEGTPFVCLTKDAPNVFKCPTERTRRRRSRSKIS